ncbi:small secreted protein [Streptomyces sp. NPDC057702]|uniref:small secreted protein n=1 Tax=unclassified Streptomyces TaxID=2593676 RepID=UPI00367A907C
MNKKLVAALSGGAALVLALTGCGGDGDDGDKKVESWAEKVCGGVQPQLKKIQEANAAIQGAADEPDSKKLQQTDSQAFQQISDAYRALGQSVKDAGAPPVDDGEKAQTEAVKELNATSRAYEDLKTSVDKLDTKDKSKFADGLNGIAEKLNKLAQSGDDAFKQLQEGEVGEAMAKQKGCQRPSGGAPAPSMDVKKPTEKTS